MLDASKVAGLINQLIPAWDLSAITEVEYLPGGYSNHNFAFAVSGARFVLRVPQVKQPYVNRYHEADWYNRLPANIGVQPVVLDQDSGLMILPWVEGEHLIDDKAKHTAEDIVGYLKRLHAKLPAIEHTYDVASLNQQFWGTSTPPYPVNTPDVMRTCHNDLNPWNILITAEGWITLDWEFVGQNDPLFDLVTLHQGLELPEADLTDLAHLFVGDNPAIANRLDHALRAFWTRELGWAHYQLEHGNQREEIVAQKESALEKLASLP